MQVTHGVLVVTLPNTKSGKRKGAVEHVPVEDPQVVQLISFLAKDWAPADLFIRSSHAFRVTFDALLARLHVQHLGLRPYSLRRGGATAFFQKTGRMDATQERGRWASAPTARIYLTEGQQALVNMNISAELEAQLQARVHVLLTCGAF